jgi:hypothetical protein
MKCANTVPCLACKHYLTFKIFIEDRPSSLVDSNASVKAKTGLKGRDQEQHYKTNFFATDEEDR